MIREFVVMLAPVFGLAFIKAQIDYYLIKKGKGVNHLLEWVILAALFVLYDIRLGIFWKALPFQSISFWLLFDVYLNSKRDLQLFYVGRTAAIDRFFQSFDHPGITMLITKFVLLIVTAYLYLVL